MSISFLVYIVILQKWLAFEMGLFPVYGWELADALKYLVLPWFIYVLATLGPKVLLFRSAMLEEVHRDYVRTAYAKGLSKWSVFSRHILGNSLLPIVTLSLSQMPAVITGSLLLEAYFGIPGVGGLLATAIRGSDFPVIQALTVIGSVIYILFNLLNDVLCAFLDPRLELE
jgi:peptide/nickel transport system permease protein